MIVPLYPEYPLRLCLQNRETYLFIAIQMVFVESTPLGFGETILTLSVKEKAKK